MEITMPQYLEPKWKSYVAVSQNPVFTTQQCDEVIRIGQTQRSEKGAVGVGTIQQGVISKGTAGKIDPKKRISKISFIPFDIGAPVYRTLERWIMDVNANHFGFDGVQISETAQYTEYDAGGFYEWHTDSNLTFEDMPPVRKISLTLLLSDPKDFDGGQLELVADKNRPPLKRGEAIFFASFIPHQVKPVTRGNRKSLVMWFGGPSLK